MEPLVESTNAPCRDARAPQSHVPVVKRLRGFVRPLGTVLGLTGAVAALNRGLRESSGIPVNHLGGTRRPWRWRGFDIFATELGAGPPLVLVHGIYAGASSFEFRKIAPLLARTHRIIAFDLLGCGLSEMPPLPYSAELFVEQIIGALDSLAGGPVTMVGSSLGGALAIRAAARAHDRVARLVAIAPTGVRGSMDGPPAAPQRVAGALLRSPIAGELMFNGIGSSASISSFLRREIYADPAAVTPELVAHYRSVVHQPGARYVPAASMGGALLCDVARDLPFVEAPVLVLWGERSSRTNPIANAAEYVRLAKHGSLATFARSGLLPHEEEPDAVSSTIEAFTRQAP
jgi:pimeloyl-ACP methyl ester carboxylesterase